MICEHLSVCTFMEKVVRLEPSTAKIIKLTYCEKDKYGCARYKVSKLLHVTEMDVPDELWPSDDLKSLESLDTQVGKDYLG